jgi:hypothetical protein
MKMGIICCRNRLYSLTSQTSTPILLNVSIYPPFLFSNRMNSIVHWSLELFAALWPFPQKYNFTPTIFFDDDFWWNGFHMEVEFVVGDGNGSWRGENEGKVETLIAYKL